MATGRGPSLRRLRLFSLPMRRRPALQTVPLVGATTCRRPRNRSLSKVRWGPLLHHHAQITYLCSVPSRPLPAYAWCLRATRFPAQVAVALHSPGSALGVRPGVMMARLGPCGQYDQRPQCLDDAPLETKTLQPQTASLAGWLPPQAPIAQLPAQAHGHQFQLAHTRGTGMTIPAHVVDFGNHPEVVATARALPCCTSEPML